jgi:hypothetical protein
MSETPRTFKLLLKSATDLCIPPDLEIDASGAVAFSGVGFVADVEHKMNSRGRANRVSDRRGHRDSAPRASRRRSYLSSSSGRPPTHRASKASGQIAVHRMVFFDTYGPDAPRCDSIRSALTDDIDVAVLVSPPVVDEQCPRAA